MRNITFSKKKSWEKNSRRGKKCCILRRHLSFRLQEESLSYLKGYEIISKWKTCSLSSKFEKKSSSFNQISLVVTSGNISKATDKVVNIWIFSQPLLPLVKESVISPFKFRNVNCNASCEGTPSLSNWCRTHFTTCLKRSSLWIHFLHKQQNGTLYPVPQWKIIFLRYLQPELLRTAIYQHEFHLFSDLFCIWDRDTKPGIVIKVH